MKTFMYLTLGFEKPTPEIMQAWGRWFDEIKDRIVAQGHFPRGREISGAGVKDLPLAADSITGYVVVRAETFDEAADMARKNPFVASIRIYEIMAG